jgi:hypothetical protein
MRASRQLLATAAPVATAPRRTLAATGMPIVRSTALLRRHHHVHRVVAKTVKRPSPSPALLGTWDPEDGLPPAGTP